jgi:photosystem II stability/assembly factor-like uncharacterized protein
VLYETSDAGGRWKRLGAGGLDADAVLVPSGFGGRHAELFAMSPAAGLQRSQDGGATFAPALTSGNAASGPIAVSPAFDSGDPRLLIGAQTLLEYHDDSRTLTPADKVAAAGPLQPAFAPGYPRDGRLLVGAHWLDQRTGRYTAGVLVCDAQAVCAQTPLSGETSPPVVRPSPSFASSGTAFAFTPFALFVSHDGARSFIRPAVPWEGSVVRDVAVTESRVYVAVTAGTTLAPVGLFVSSDGGSSWRRVSDRALDAGATAVAASGSRVLAAPAGGGVACSPDAGATWQSRCAV